MKKDIYLIVLASLCILLVTLDSCTSETDILSGGTADGTPLTVRATASGFQAPAQPGGSPTTRTPVMEGTSTKFQTATPSGLFCVRKNASGTEYISTDIYNLKMTYTAAADGPAPGKLLQRPPPHCSIPMRWPTLPTILIRTH